MAVVSFCALILTEIQNCFVLMSTLFDLPYMFQNNKTPKNISCAEQLYG